MKVDDVSGISQTEAHIWRWLALTEAGQPQTAEALCARLLKRDLPPLYEQFLKDPPEV